MDNEQPESLISILQTIADELAILNSTLKKMRNGSYYGPTDTDLQI